MSNQLPPESAWHLAFHSELLSQYGHKGMQVPSQAVDESREVLDRHLFERPADAEECSVNVRPMTEKRRGAWKAMSYEAWNSASVRLLAAIKSQGR